jgi:hypothetical protein
LGVYDYRLLTKKVVGVFVPFSVPTHLRNAKPAGAGFVTRGAAMVYSFGITAKCRQHHQ